MEEWFEKPYHSQKKRRCLRLLVPWRIWFITMEDLSNPCEKNPIAIKDNGIPDLQLWQLA